MESLSPLLELNSHKVFDFHVHVFPELNPSIAKKIPRSLRSKARDLFSPFAKTLHQIQPYTRHLPAPIRTMTDQLSILGFVPQMLFERTPDDLFDAMSASHIDGCVVIAHPPYCTNEFVLALAKKKPSIIPAVNVPINASRPSIALKNYIQDGAKILKIHAAADGEDLSSTRYNSLLKTATENQMPVIIHTGMISLKPAYKNPALGNVLLFEKWFKNYPSTPFILAHMNFHKPTHAFELAERYPNLYVDTSWQPDRKSVV